MLSALIELVPAVVFFCLAMTITPGPNNILLAHSGAHFGFKKTLPHVIGIRLGMTLLHTLILLGLGQLFKQWPQLQQSLSILAAGYIIFLAIKIARSTAPDTQNKLQPMGIFQAAVFQFINPKSWAMLLTASTTFTLAGDLFWPSAILSLLLFNLATLPGTFMWISIGKMVANKLQQAKFHRAFNLTMSFLLLLTLPFIFIGK